MLDELDDLLDKVCGDARTYGDRESVELLHRHLLTSLEAATTVATAALDASGDWRGTGARTAAGWLSVCCNLPKSAASRRLHLGRALRHLPVAEEAWLAGDIGGAQVSLLAHARTPVTEDAMARDEALLVGKAKELRYSHFVRAMAYWSQHADPDGAEDTAEKQRDERGGVHEMVGGVRGTDVPLGPGAPVVVRRGPADDERTDRPVALAGERHDPAFGCRRS